MFMYFTYGHNHNHNQLTNSQNVVLIHLPCIEQKYMLIVTVLYMSKQRSIVVNIKKKTLFFHKKWNILKQQSDVMI